jgi:hypothetical protein
MPTALRLTGTSRKSRSNFSRVVLTLRTASGKPLSFRVNPEKSLRVNPIAKLSELRCKLRHALPALSASEASNFTASFWAFACSVAEKTQRCGPLPRI